MESGESRRIQPCARRNLELDLPEAVATAVWEFVNGDLLINPYRVGKALRFDLEGFHSARSTASSMLRSVVSMTWSPMFAAAIVAL